MSNISLYKFNFCGASRFIQLYLNEMNIEYVSFNENPYNVSDFVRKMNPALNLPVLITNNTPIVGALTIAEFIRENTKGNNYFLGDSEELAEIRRVCNWFLYKYDSEVTKKIIHERVIKRMFNLGSPDSKSLRDGIINLNFHMNYIESIIDDYQFIASSKISIADFIAASYISLSDYTNSVNWQKYPHTKIWYSRIKSRPSFRHILEYSYGPIPPSNHYKKLDF